MLLTDIQNKIIEVANQYVGIKELKGNMGWEDKIFEAKMKKIGWYKTAPWCMFFVKLVWTQAYAELYPTDNTHILSIISSNITGGSIDSAERVKKYKDFQFSGVPQPGAIAIYRKTATTGHGAIVITAGEDITVNIEGNTNGAGSRDGDKVARKNRAYKTKSGLELLGFVIPKVF